MHQNSEQVDKQALHLRIQQSQEMVIEETMSKKSF